MRLLNDILSVLLDEGEASKITILHKANLDSRLLNKYLNLLNDTGLIELENRKGKISIRITDKGTRFIVLYKELRRMINAKHSSSSNTKPAL
ncbi:winged helix-turn-helix domain-containing protein [Candidatus Nitrosocaldus cavascurensis]|uniref:winged helix-turn-helix domain-containing protein n=1 Tax=Candidatus Nitrosocaldus cavascurensis TaxID=2058097 RepID=UPI000CD23D1B|nr:MULTISPECIES: winged helix-turn-helix domain-containing protein [Candidatus Nitrosocaldus]